MMLNGGGKLDYSYLGVLSSLFIFKNDLTGDIMCMLKQLKELICTTGP